MHNRTSQRDVMQTDTLLSSIFFNCFCKQEITIVEGAMAPYAEETRAWIILPLHSTLSIEEQDKVVIY